MGGCIALFEAIDPGVMEIRTFAGSVPDTWYRRRGKVWDAGIGNTLARQG
jgi:hypothetical protein